MNGIKWKRNDNSVVKDGKAVARRAAVCDEISLQETSNVSVIAAKASRVAE